MQRWGWSCLYHTLKGVWLFAHTDDGHPVVFQSTAGPEAFSDWLDNIDL